MQLALFYYYDALFASLKINKRMKQLITINLIYQETTGRPST